MDPIGVASQCPVVREVMFARVRARELGIRGSPSVLQYISDRLRDRGDRIGGDLGQRFKDAAEQCRLVAVDS